MANRPDTTFVLHEHATSAGVHYDLMVRPPGGGRLWTWRLAALPEPGRAADAKRLPDHRAAYLSREGPVAGGRGSVAIRDRGPCVLQQADPGRVVLALSGKTLRGLLRLEQREGDAWRLQFDDVVEQGQGHDRPAED
jgi:hypothetical protein